MTHKKIPPQRPIPTWKLEHDLAGWLANPLTSEYDIDGNHSPDAITYSEHLSALIKSGWPIHRVMHVGDVAPQENEQESLYLPYGFSLLHLAAYGGKTNFIYNIIANETAQARKQAAEMPSHLNPTPRYQWRVLPEDTTGGTPLHYAAFNSRTDAILALTSCCKLLNLPLLSQDKYGSTPLDIAIYSFSPEQLLSYISTLALHDVSPQDILPDYVISTVAEVHGSHTAAKLTLLRKDPKAFFEKFSNEVQLLQAQITCATENFSATFNHIESFVAEESSLQHTQNKPKPSVTPNQSNTAGWALRAKTADATSRSNSLN